MMNTKPIAHKPARAGVPYKIDFAGEVVDDYRATIAEYGLNASGAGPSPKKAPHASRVLHLMTSLLGWRG